MPEAGAEIAGDILPIRRDTDEAVMRRLVEDRHKCRNRGVPPPAPSQA